jgi:hypothetical protein
LSGYTFRKTIGNPLHYVYAHAVPIRTKQFLGDSIPMLFPAAAKRPRH